MAFPVIRGSLGITTAGSTAGTTQNVLLPASVSAGDLLIAALRSDAATNHSWPAGWNRLFFSTADASNDGFSVAWKKAAGTEGGTSVAVTATGSGKYSAVSAAVFDCADPTVTPPEVTSVATGTSANPNSPSLAPSGGAKDYKWLSIATMEGEQSLTTITRPTGFANIGNASGSGTGGAVTTNTRTCFASIDENATSKDPAAWTFSVSDDWMAVTLAIFPVGAPPPITGTVASTQAPGISAVAGALVFDAALASTQAPSASATLAVLTFSAALASIQPPPTSAAAAALTFAAAVVSVQAPTLSAAEGTIPADFTATVASVQALTTSSVSGALVFAGTVASAAPPATSTAEAALTFSAAASSLQSRTRSAVAGDLVFSAAAASTQAPSTSAAAGGVTFVGAVTSQQARTISAAEGTFVITAAVASAQPRTVSSAAAGLVFSAAVDSMQDPPRSFASESLSFSGTVASFIYDTGASGAIGTVTAPPQGGSAGALRRRRSRSQTPVAPYFLLPPLQQLVFVAVGSTSAPPMSSARGRTAQQVAAALASRGATTRSAATGVYDDQWLLMARAEDLAIESALFPIPDELGKKRG